VLLKRTVKYIFNFPIFLLLVFLLFISFNNDSYALIKSSDTLSLSGPGISADHTIRFGVVRNIPVGGSIEIVIDADFVVPMDFDFDNIDLAVSTTTYDGIYSDRSLSNVVLPLTETVSVSTSSSGHTIVFSLNSGAAVSAGDFIEIELGSNAEFERVGSSTQIINASSVGSKSIDIGTFDNTSELISKSQAPVFIILPVAMTADSTKKRTGASPVGWLGYGTTETIMSLHTNFDAVCRYAETEGVAYDDMVDEFSYMIPGFYHSHITSVTGLSNGSSYEYYVRCRDTDGVSDDYTECIYDVASTSPFTTASGTPILEQDCIDMPITFQISSIAGASGDETGTGGSGDDSSSTATGSGGSGGGGGGGGGTGNSSGRDRGIYLPYPPSPGAPGVALKGWGYPISFVQILQDGNIAGWTNSASNGEFAVFLEDLIRGMYTFGIWSNDLESRKSGTYSTTFWVEEGTQTTVTDIIIPPTFDIATSSAVDMQAFGYSTPGASVEVWVYPMTFEAVDESKVKKFNATVPSNGKWNANVDLATLVNGEYYIKARTVIESMSPGEFSQILSFTKDGEELTEDEGVACPGADLNRDGKVNITDFSILLYYWGTDDACADQNSNGNVDLIDFSIMMYHWTG
jgi:hypothetical protein